MTSCNIQHDKPWPISTSVSLYKPLNSDKLDGQSWTTLNPQEHHWTGNILVCVEVACSDFLINDKGIFSQVRILSLILFLKHTLVLLNKAIHVFPYCSEKGLNETHSKNQTCRTTETESRFKSEFSSSYFIWSTAHWTNLTHDDTAD